MGRCRIHRAELCPTGFESKCGKCTFYWLISTLRPVVEYQILGEVYEHRNVERVGWWQRFSTEPPPQHGYTEACLLWRECGDVGGQGSSRKEFRTKEKEAGCLWRV